MREMLVAEWAGAEFWKRVGIVFISLSVTLVVANFVFIVLDYRNLWVHPHYFTDLMPIYTQDGRGFHWTDLLRALDHKRPGEYRPRFLSYLFLGFDIRLR